MQDEPDDDNELDARRDEEIQQQRREAFIQIVLAFADDEGWATTLNMVALAMRERFQELSGNWRKLGYDLGFGVGIAQGYATIGAIGFEGRWDYGAIGTVTNLAARLCGEAKGGQILIHQRLATAIETLVDLEEIGPLTLKGLLRPVPAFNILSFKATT
jgi:class 3 adenylate cyclase